METRFPHLFQPGRIGSMEVNNRIFMAPMATGFCESDGRYSQRQIDSYVTRARGGAGLIETEACAVERTVSKWPSFPSNSLESALGIPRAYELTSAVHTTSAPRSRRSSRSAREDASIARRRPTLRFRPHRSPRSPIRRSCAVP